MNLLKKIILFLTFTFMFLIIPNNYKSSKIDFSYSSNVVQKASTYSSYSLLLNVQNADQNNLKEGYTSIIEAKLTPETEDNIIYFWVINGERIENANGSTESYSWTKINNFITITAISNNGSLNIVCSAYLENDLSNALAQNAVVLNLQKRDSTVAEIISSIMNNQAVIVFVVGIAATIFYRTAIKIFRFGVSYKSNFATVEQQKEFESSVKEDMRNTRTELQETLLKSCMRVIERETAPLKELKQIQDDVKTTKTALDLQLKNINEKYNDLRKTTDSIRDLEKRVDIIQYGDSEPTRRSGK